MRAIEQKTFPIGRTPVITYKRVQAAGNGDGARYRRCGLMRSNGNGGRNASRWSVQAQAGALSGVLMRMDMIRDTPSLSKGLGTIKKASAPCGDSRLERDYT